VLHQPLPRLGQGERVDAGPSRAAQPGDAEAPGPGEGAEGGRAQGPTGEEPHHGAAGDEGPGPRRCQRPGDRRRPQAVAHRSWSHAARLTQAPRGPRLGWRGRPGERPEGVRMKQWARFVGAAGLVSVALAWAPAW